MRLFIETYQVCAGLLILMFLLTCCGATERRQQACAHFCGAQEFKINRDGLFGADARVRWWCTCADGAQKEIF